MADPGEGADPQRNDPRKYEEIPDPTRKDNWGVVE